MENMKAVGSVRLRLREKPGGRILHEEEGPNMVVNTGLAAIAGMLGGVETAPYIYIGLGTDNTAAAAGQTALLAEITTGGGERKAGTATRSTIGVADDTLNVEAIFTFTAGFSVNEIGLFNDALAGIMVARRIPAGAPIVVVNGNVFEVLWKIRIV